MAIPTFQEITLPLLTLASDGQVRSLATARKELAAHFRLTEAEESELLPSGRQGRFANRVAWAKVYLISVEPQPPVAGFAMVQAQRGRLFRRGVDHGDESGAVPAGSVDAGVS